MRLLPTWCYQCHRFIGDKQRAAHSAVCLSCSQNLPFSTEAVCEKCGHAHPTAGCQTEWAKQVSRFFSIFQHKDPIHEWISGLKYSRNLSAGKVLQEFVAMWCDYNSDLIAHIDVIIPVPLHWKRLRSRGFNQSAYLLNKQQQIVVDGDVVKRVRHTPHQAGLSKEERASNLDGAFELLKSVKKQKIMLFDDVCTTGKTIAEISKVLRKGGVEEIYVLVVSRAK